jgi:hypothetical protein
MRKINSVGTLVSFVAVVFATYSATVVATDKSVKAKIPMSEVVYGSDVKFNWTYKNWQKQFDYILFTSAGDRVESTDEWHYTWADFPYGYGWWYVETSSTLLPLPFVINSTSATQFHHEFPDDWSDEFTYTTKFNENKRLKFFELKKDYIIDLSEKFDPEYLPELYATDTIAEFYKDWSMDRSDPSLDWDFINFDSGVLTIKQGYRWDGASYPCKDFGYLHCIDDTYNIRSSLVHDVLYDLMRMEYLEWDPTEPETPIDPLFELLRLPPIKEACSDNGATGDNDEGYANRAMADLLLYMIGVEEGQVESLDDGPWPVPVWPAYRWIIIYGDDDGAMLNERSAEIDFYLMRLSVVAPATCEENRLAFWKYHVSELTATGSDGKVDLTWKPANDAGKEPGSHSALNWPHLGYSILRSQVVISTGGSTDPSTPAVALIDTVDSTDTSYTDNTVSDGNTYVYQISRVPNNISPIQIIPVWFKFHDYSNEAKATVINIAPTVDAGLDATFDEGDTFTYSGSFTDPGDDTWTATVDYGDGAGDQPLALTGKIFDLSHVYANNGVYTVTVTVTDYDAGVGSDTALITVDNVAPFVSIDSVDQPNPHFILPLVHTLTFNGSFTDPGWLDTHSSNWDFDDGTDVAGTLTEENAPPGSTGDSTSQHAYSAAGVYNVILGIMDNDGGIGTDSKDVTVISPGEAISIFSQYIQGLQGNAFKNNAGQRKNAFSNKLAEVLEMINAGDYQAAIIKLQNDIRAKANGYVGGNPKNDWIRVSAAQQEICWMVDDLIAYLETM